MLISTTSYSYDLAGRVTTQCPVRRMNAQKVQHVRITSGRTVVEDLRHLAVAKVTTIQRDGNGNPTAIVAPGGQTTALTLEGNGYLQSVTNPNNEKVELTYSADGLLATMKDGRGNQASYAYDAQGRLARDDDPAGGFKALTRTEQTTGWTVNLATALNRTTTYQVEHLPIGDLRRKVTEPSGLLTTTLIKPDGSRRAGPALRDAGAALEESDGPNPP